MIFGLLKRRRSAEPSASEAAYAAIVEASRRPALYTDFGVPDTLPGRFELIVLHAALYLRRLRGEGPEADARAQEVTDAMFAAMDVALREIGVGDVSVPKNIKTMARSFYDGAALYDVALAARDAEALTAALKRIVYRGAADEGGSGPRRLAAYVVRASDALAAQPAAALVARGPIYPELESAP